MNNKPFKIKRSDYNRILWCSDLHIDHDRPWIVDARGFKDIKEHNKWIIDQLYSLDKDDLLINLGDFTLASSVEATETILKNIPCRHFYINGNHESFVSKVYFNALAKFWKNYEADEYDPNVDQGNRFISLYPLTINGYLGNPNIEHPSTKNIYEPSSITFFGESATFGIDNRYYYCRHIAPFLWDHMKHDNQYSICGHSHNGLARAQVESKRPKQLDIGVDSALKYNGTCFFSIEEINKIMDNKTTEQFDHH